MLCSTCKASFTKCKEYFTHAKRRECSPWRQVVELKAIGKEAEADRIARKAMGVYQEMTEEAKEKLRQYYEDHKEEIIARAKLKRMTQKKIMENLQNKSTTIKRKAL